MMNREQYQEHIERTFNAFCKIVLYHAALGVYKKLRKKQRFEVSLDYLREFDFEPAYATDEHFVKYDLSTTFTVRGKTVVVKSEQLAAALLRLPEKRREELFLWYTSVTAMRKSVRCAVLAEVQFSADGRLPCAYCEKKWRR